MTNKKKELITKMYVYAMAQDQRNLTCLTSLSILVAFSPNQQQMMLKYFSAFLERVHPLVICKLMFAVCCGGKCPNYHSSVFMPVCTIVSPVHAQTLCVGCDSCDSIKAHILFASITSVLPSKLSHLQWAR